MKKQYKNKRDFYKSQAEYWKKEALKNEEKINNLKKVKEEERVDCAWFCPTCRVVEKGTKGIDFDLEGSRCLRCGHLGVMVVAKLPLNYM